MNKLHIIILLFILPIFSYGQTTVLPKIVPPSPQAQEFMKYIDYPVDFSTGIPKNEIPIYNINCGKLSLPIAITYNSSGLIPSEESGKIGLGWSLNYGGNISRVMKGCPDERFYNKIIPTETEVTAFSSSVLTKTDPYYGEFSSLDVGGYDTEYDIFYYSLPNQNGRFIFNRNNDIAEFNKPVLLPYHPIKIIPQLSGSGNDLSFEFFNVLDEKGNFYRFGKSLVTGQLEYEDYRLTSTPSTAQTGKSAWLLTQIVSADKADTIHFEYEYIMNSKSVSTAWLAKLHHTFSNTYTAYIGGCINGSGCNTNDSSTPGSSFSGYEYTSKRIKTIKFKHNELRFSYKDTHYPNSLLTKIEIYDDAQSKIIRTINLSQTKYHTNSSRLNWDKLDYISFHGEDGQMENKYTFEYNTSIQFPLINDNNSIETYSVDFWGYYNGASNTNPIPPNAPGDHSITISGTADRNANPIYSQAGILKKVIFPTGGDATFYFGGNKIGSSSVGGVRIDSIILNSGNSQIKKTYEYNNGIGISLVDPIYSFSRSLLRKGVSDASIYETTSYSSDLVSDIDLNGRPVTYTDITEYFGNKSLNNGKIEHYYNASVLTTQLTPDFLPAPVGPLQNVHWENDQIDYFQRYLKFGDLLEYKTIYFNSSDTHVKEINKYFNNTILGSFNGLKVRRQVTDLYGYEKIKYFAYSTYTFNQLAQTLDSVVTTDYFSGNSISITEQYKYNSRLLLTYKETQKNNGTFISTYKYPEDFSSPGNDYETMVNRNIISPIIEQTDYINNTTTPLQSVKTNYKDWGNNIIAPETEVSTNGSSTPETRVHYYNYDAKGNVREVSKENDIHIIYIWSYNQTYPIAKIDNSDFSTVETVLGGATVVTAFSQKANPTDAEIKTFLAPLFADTRLKNAMVTTYTYKPLVGMTSSTTPDGVKAYYEYDTFGRLQYIKDDDGRILKSYEYHYKP